MEIHWTTFPFCGFKNEFEKQQGKNLYELKGSKLKMFCKNKCLQFDGKAHVLPIYKPWKPNLDSIVENLFSVAVSIEALFELGLEWHTDAI